MSRFKKQPEISIPTTAEIGWEDSNIYHSKDFPKYNPDMLMARKGSDIYKKMMRDDQVKACMQFKTHAVVSREWFFDIGVDQDGEERNDHKEIADVFEYMINAINGSFSDNLIGILSGLQNGFSITEKIYHPIMYDNKEYWGIKDLKLRPHSSFNGGFKTDNHGNILKLIQTQMGQPIEIPLSKIIHFVHQPDIDLHYGESDLSACYRPWWSKDIGIKFMNIHLERHASGFIWAKITGALTTTQKTNLQNLLNNISARMSAQIPENIDLNAMQPLRTDAYEKAIIIYDKAIAKSILVPNLLGLSEQGQTGSYSQSQTQLSAFFWILDAISKRLSQSLNEQLFRELALWNFGTDDFPWFKFEPISDDQKAEIAKSWNELVKGGSVTKSDSDEAYVRQIMGFPEKVEEPVIEPGAEPEETPDNEDWIEAQPNAEFIRKEFSEKKWLKRVNFTRLEKTFNRSDEGFINNLNAVMAQARVSIEKQIIKIIGQRSLGNVKPKEIETVSIPPGLVSKIRKVVRDNMQVVLDNSYAIAQKELPKKQFRIGPGMDKNKANQFLSSKAMKIAGVIEQDVLKAVQQVLENGLKYDKTLQETIRSMADDTTLMQVLPEVNAAGRATNIPARLENIARTNTAEAINQGRMSVFGADELKGFVQAYEYSAILDDRVTDICEHLHGKILKDFGSYLPPNHFQCRSILVPVTTVDDWDGKEAPKPRLEPHKGFA